MNHRWVSAAIALLMTVSAFAGANRWTTSGPEVGYANAIVVDPKNSNVLYAGSPGGGIFKTWDGGEHWYAINRGIEGSVANAGGIAIDPVNSNVVYFGTNGGMYKTVDGGSHWTKLSFAYSVGTLLIDPKNNSIVYSANSDGIWKSTNGGESFTQLTVPMKFMNDMVIDPNNTSILYVASADTQSGGVYKSTDSGTSWNKISAQIPFTKIYTLAIDPKNPSKVWAGTPQNGVWFSPDAGNSWTKKSGGASGMPDGGNWQAASISSVSNHVYWGSNGGLYVTTNDGNSWLQITPDESYMMVLAVDPTSASTLYVSTEMSLLKSVNNGNSWTSKMSGWTSFEPEGIVTNPASAQIAYTYGSDGIFRTANGGASWSRAGDRVYVNGVAIDPQNPSTLYAQHQLQFAKSVDGGTTWSTFTNAGVQPGNVATLIHDPIKPATIYAGYFDTGLWVNSNGGTWQPLNTGLPANTSVLQIAFDTITPSTMYIATNKGLYKSSSSGSNWTPMSNGLASTNAASVVVVTSHPQTLYAIAGYRLYKSTDGAGQWTRVTDDSTYVYSVVATSGGTDVFVAVDQGVLRSRDGGTTWTLINAGRDFAYTQILALSAADTIVYSSGSHSGVFALRPSSVLLPVAASLHGNGGSFFHSDVMLVNPSQTTSMNVQATYRCYTGTCGDATKTITIAPKQALAYSDIVAGLFHAAETGGPIEFDAPAHLIAASRLYTPSKPSPTFGQFVPGLTLDAATSRGILPLLSSSSGAGGFRSNVGLYNPNNTAETITVTLLSETGIVLGSIQRSLNAQSGTQINNVFGAAGYNNDVTSAYAIVTTASGKPALSYASVLDNQSQDPIFVVAQDGEFGMTGTITVPAAASLHGQNNAFFHSDVAVVNISTIEAVNVTAYYRCSSGNCGVSPKTFTIPAGQAKSFDDIVVTLFGASESGGAIEFQTSGRIAVASRLYTPSKPAPTFGQYVPGLPLDRAAGRLIVPSLSFSADSTTGFRSNVGVYNPTDIAQDVTFSLYQTDGTFLGKTTRNVAARALVQINNIFLAAGVAQNVESAYCVMEGVGNVPLFGFASVLDNQSQDPIFVVGQSDGE